MNLLKSVLVIALFSTTARAEPPKPVDITVYRSASCSCCGKWLEHLKANNFNVKDMAMEDVLPIKQKQGITDKLASCHTALVGDYVIEGHVPANDIMKLLKSKPKVIGLAVPGMVNGSPGMEMGEHKNAYEVVSFDKDQKMAVFSSYPESK
ncbi:MAG: DUF411 domain-containing protein [Methylococcales bacterium]|jgi:hypothetical protein|nr:MAG: DUF411 domain-containing protein [Methylococcales bacterium]